MVRPPPPAARMGDRPATTSDVDRIMSSIGALSGKFDGIQTDIVALKGKVAVTAERVDACLLYTSPSPRD